MAENPDEKSRRDVHLARAAAQKAAAEKRKAKEDRLRAAIDNLLRSEDGRLVFTFLFHICGYNQADIPKDALEQVNSGVLLYNATRRAVYAKLRSHASRALLTPVEEAAEMSADEEVKMTTPEEK